ncbi:MAG: primary-amine oxidase, partial [Acidimicrobiales bacterium]
MTEATLDQAGDAAEAITHPLEALTAAEIHAAVTAVRADDRLGEDARFASITLEPPGKDVLAAYRPGDPVDRLVRLVIVPGRDSVVIEALVDMSSGNVASWQERLDVRPALLFDDALRSIEALRRDPDWQEAVRRRGITDFDKVQIDPWPTGNFGRAIEERRRITRCLSYYREAPTDNGYARPLEGIIATVDGARGEVLEVIDYGVVPLPSDTGSYYPEDHQPARIGLKPLEIVQPEGPSFTVESNLICWQGWSMRVSMDPNDGLVLHTIGYAEGNRIRPLLHRASITEMVVPYGDPGP